MDRNDIAEAMKRIESVPGMIEKSEQLLLLKYASSIKINPEECFVEFGVFFGNSTACLAEGLLLNQKRYTSTKIFAYDSFNCPVDGKFVEQVREFAELCKRKSLLIERNGYLDFEGISREFLDGYLNRTLIEIKKGQISAYHAEEKPIALMHLDAPKSAQELSPIIRQSFPLLRSKSIIIFQDFFYHWSASSIAIIGKMMREGFLCPIESAATSLICEVNAKFHKEYINELLLCTDKKLVMTDLDFAIEATENLPSGNDKSIYPARLYLAKIQHLYEGGKPEEAATVLVEFLNRKRKFSLQSINDFIEMFRYGFHFPWNS